MTDKEAMQMALETAEQIASADYRHWGELASLGEFERWARSRANHIAEALRARLAQPENDFNPDWDAMAVMVEEQQRMAKRIEELEARLAQPEQEPVAWFCKLPDDKISIKIVGKPTEGNWQPLYTTPPQREWVGLRDKEIEDCLEMSIQGTCRAIEAKLKEKNND